MWHGGKWFAGTPSPDSSDPPPAINLRTYKHHSLMDVVETHEPLSETTLSRQFHRALVLEKLHKFEPLPQPLPKYEIYPYHFELEKIQPLPLPLQSTRSKKKKKANLGPYSVEQKILLVGEGDFSFSASLAVAFGDASNIVATSLNSKKFLRTNYANAGININELTSRGCKVIHGVDATKMARHPQLWYHKFDRIVFNFPHAGFSNLKASREEQIREHQALVKGFLKNAKKMINEEDGQIHITHKCVGFSLKWDLETLGSSQRLRLVQETPFNVKHYPGYATKYGFGGDGDFDSWPSKTYIFQLLK